MQSVSPDDLIDSTEVAAILGLGHRNSVSTYQRRYPDFPRPLVSRGRGRINLWLRKDIVSWRPARSAPQAPGLPTSEDRRDALIDAAAELMARRPIGEISVREIAARAGVPHTLIYRHVGSKQDLEQAVIERTEREIAAMAQGDAQTTLSSMESLVRVLLSNRDPVLVLVHAMLSEPSAAKYTTQAPIIKLFLSALLEDAAARRAAALPQPEPEFPELTPETAVGAVAALLVGWTVFEPRIRTGTGLTSTPVTELAALSSAILNLSRPQAGQGAGAPEAANESQAAPPTSGPTSP
jgi:AcrR family transcriptional regulator